MQTTATKTKWIVDPTHSSIGFSVKHMMMTTVRGEFERYTIEAETEGEDFLKADIRFSAETASVNTRNEQRDTHLRSEDFFKSEEFPEITFVPTKFERVDNDDMYTMHGDLTMRGVTRNIKLDVEFGGVLKNPWGNAVAGFIINGKINRKDFGLNWNAALETGGVLVSEEVKLHIELQLVEAL